MSKIKLTKKLSATTVYSKRKLVEFLENLRDEPYFLTDFELQPLIENLLQEWDVDFCLIECHGQFEQIVSNLFAINTLEIIDELAEKDHSMKIFKELYGILDLGEALFEAFVLSGKYSKETDLKKVWQEGIKKIYKTLHKKIQKKEETTFTLQLSNGKNANISIGKPAIFHLKLNKQLYKIYLDNYAFYFHENHLLLGEEYFNIHNKAFVLFFEVSIQLEGFEQPLKKPFLMMIDRELLGLNTILKFRFPINEPF